MISPALTRTRIAVSALMASATLATATLATSLALAQDRKDDTTSATTSGSTSTTRTPRSTVGTHDHPRPSSHSQRTATSNPGFGQASQSSNASQPSHTRTKGS